MEKILKDIVQYVRKNYFSYWVILGTGTAVSVLRLLIACAVIHYMAYVPIIDWMFCKFACISLVVDVAGSLLFRTYRNTIRSLQICELWCIMCAALFKAACLVITSSGIIYRTQLLYNYKISYPLLDGLLALIILMTSCVSLIIVYDFLLGRVDKRNTCIPTHGTNEESVALKSRPRDSAYCKVVGFYVYSKNNSQRRLADLPVYYLENKSDVDHITRKCGIKGILSAYYEDTHLEGERLPEYCKNNELKTLIAPTISRANSGGNFYQWVRPTKIEDLLDHVEININLRQAAEGFRGEVVLVADVTGSIGNELCRQSVQMGIQKPTILGSAETPLYNARLKFEKKYPNIDLVPVIDDVCVRERVRTVFELYHSQIVFHAVVYKYVPLMEENSCEVMFVDVTGSRQVADMAVGYSVEKMAIVSTDEAASPTNVMGYSKRSAEIYAQSLGCVTCEGKTRGHAKFITTRSGNVLGSDGSAILRFKEQIENGGSVTTTHPDIVRFFTTILEACRLVVEAATTGEGNETFVLEMRKAIKIVDLTARMIELASYRPGEDTKIEFTGLCPGERLHEEVLSGKENTIPTRDKKAMIAKVRRYEYVNTLDTYAEFKRLSHAVKIMNVVRLIKKIVPKFKSKNSPRFEISGKE